MPERFEVACVVVGMLQGNCYLVRLADSGEGLVIDPGDQADVIAREIKGFKLRPEAILLTHGHIDHANAAAELRDRLKARVVCHKLDAPLVRARDEEDDLFGMTHRPCPVDQEVSDGDVLAVGGAEVAVLHTPGHTRGSVCYVLGGILFSGDTLFQGSIGRTDLPGGSERQMRSTLMDRIAKLDDRVVVFPGHGPRTTIGEEKQYNPFLQAQW